MKQILQACETTAFLPATPVWWSGKNTAGAAHGGPSSSQNAKTSSGFFTVDNILTEKAALQLIARAEQCVNGLHRKLKKRGFEKADIEAVIEQLCEAGLLDDRRFARLWLESRINSRRTSPWRLLVGLCNRGIDRDDAEAALREVLDEEAELRLLQRYAEKLQSQNKLQQSLHYRLKSEGFSSRAIRQLYED